MNLHVLPTTAPAGLGVAEAMRHLRAAGRALRWGMREAARRRRTRRALMELDAALLRDIGVSPAEADFEANKPFWRA